MSQLAPLKVLPLSAPLNWKLFPLLDLPLLHVFEAISFVSVDVKEDVFIEKVVVCVEQRLFIKPLRRKRPGSCFSPTRCRSLGSPTISREPDITPIIAGIAHPETDNRNIVIIELDAFPFKITSPEDGFVIPLISKERCQRIVPKNK